MSTIFPASASRACGQGRRRLGGFRHHPVPLRSELLALLNPSIRGIRGKHVGLGTSNTRPDQIAPVHMTKSVDAWFSPDSFATAVNHLGSERSGSLLGPGYNNWDLAAIKNTKIVERLSFQLRGEFFNALNHESFSSVDQSRIPARQLGLWPGHRRPLAAPYPARRQAHLLGGNTPVPRPGSARAGFPSSGPEYFGGCHQKRQKLRAPSSRLTGVPSGGSSWLEWSGASIIPK